MEQLDSELMHPDASRHAPPSTFSGEEDHRRIQDPRSISIGPRDPCLIIEDLRSSIFGAMHGHLPFDTPCVHSSNRTTNRDVAVSLSSPSRGVPVHADDVDVWLLCLGPGRRAVLGRPVTRRLCRHTTPSTSPYLSRHSS